MATPRVRPRPRMEDLVDVANHPPRKKVRTVQDDERAPGPHWTSVVAVATLAAFWFLVPVAAALIAAGLDVAGYGAAGLAGSSLVVAYFMGVE